MKNLHVNTKVLTFILFFLFLLPSCNNEEIFVVEESAIIAEETDPTEEETPNTEDEVIPIDTVDDDVNTMENTPVDIEAYLNDTNLPQSITVSNTNPSNGVLSINNNGTEANLLDDTVVYTPNAGFSGIDSFEYTVCDATNAENCDTSTVSITVNPIEEDIATELKAFPSAYGAGAYTTGGRGGTIIHVTNLNGTGAGSLYEAIMATGPRYIVFDVSGVINLTTQVHPTSGDYTVNGFSAPNGGITLIGHAIRNGYIDNIIWRGIKFRNGYLGATGYSNATELQFMNCEDVIVDRCSFAFADDGTGQGKGMSFVGNDTGIDDYGGSGTIQNCLITQSKQGYMVGNSGDDGDHFGDVSCLRNVITAVGHRHPKVGGVSYIDIINNISHDFIDRAIRLEAFNTTKLNLINNSFTSGYGIDYDDVGQNHYEHIHGYQPKSGQTPTIYEDGNFIYPQIPPNYATEPWQAWFEFNNGPFSTFPTSAWTGTKITGISGVAPIILDAADLKAELLPRVGACEYIDDSGNVQFYRDGIDTAAITTITNDAARTRINRSNYQTLAEALSPPTNTRPASYDTDNDGMADVWEIATFGDLTKTSNGDEDNDGYTNIEEFLNRVDN